jgi:hypothetical protein
MQPTRDAVRVVLPEQAETIDILGAGLAVLCDGLNLPLLLGEQIVPPGYGVPPHRHDSDDELFVMLDGELTVAGPEGEMRVGKGACVQLPRGIAHSFRNDSPQPARVLVIALPGLQALEMFRHFDSAARRPVPATPPQIMEIASQYGVHFV